MKVLSSPWGLINLKNEKWCEILTQTWKPIWLKNASEGGGRRGEVGEGGYQRTWRDNWGGFPFFSGGFWWRGSRSYSNYGGISRWHVSDLLRDRITPEKRLLEIKNRFLCTRHNLPCISHLLLCLSLHLSSPFLYCLFHKTGDTTSCLPAQYAPSAHPLCSHTCYNIISDTGLQTLGSAMDLSV